MKLVELRKMNYDDRRFVASSWLKNYWSVVVERTGLPFSVYVPSQKRRIERLLASSKVLVVYAAHIPDEILGYVVFEPGVLHWVYVKLSYRNEGIATALCKQELKWYTHQTVENTAGSKFVKKMGLTYNPYLLEKP